jgi:hypothetical protein
MSNFNNIQSKLQQFIKKYYTNELIKGLILFAAFGLLYFMFTLFVEHFLWLQPGARSVLFFVFIAVELVFFVRFILLPIFKLVGLQQGISLTKASKIIGNHFPAVDDKLLNVLQLNENGSQTELLLASIEQKSASLKPIPFRTAINFQKNIKYLKYLAIPLIIWLFTFVSGNNSIFKDSLQRVVHYKTAYEPPAPFSFKILNSNLSTIEGRPFEVQIETIGELIPDNAKIYLNEENYFLKDEGIGMFTHTFTNLKETISFYVEANGIRSRDYQLNVLKTPTVVDFKMILNYPNYTKKRNETIKNTGNAVIPEGTNITWNINTQQTDSVTWKQGELEPKKLKEISSENFSISKSVRNNLNYQISTSNSNLKDFEKLNYSIQVIKDEYPKITVKSDVDSVSRGPIQFVGQLSDDYGLSKLNLVYYDTQEKNNINKQSVKINSSSFEEFYYVFDPQGELNLDTGKDYELYFEAYDNDAVNGNKSVKSKIFSYHNKTKQEIADDLLKEQKQNLDEFNNSTKQTEKLNKDFDEFTKKLKNKSELNWNDKKEINQFLKRQEQYQEMFEKQTDKLKDNLEEQRDNENNQPLKNKKEELQKRIEETQEMLKKEKLLEELRKMAEKLDKEGMLEKLERLTEQKKQDKRSLERLLEMTKRYYVEKKANDIADELDSLSKKQDKLSTDENNEAKKQKELNKEFDDIQKDLQDLNKQNEELKQPMDFPETERDEKAVDEQMQKATENLEDQGDKKEEGNDSQDQQKEQSKKAASKNQKSAAKKMKKMSKSMKGAMMEMEGEMIEENIEGLRAILENLVTFSFDQEQLMLSLDGVNASHASYPKKLKKQQVLKEHFEHIDDSLYTLSLRLQRLTSKIQHDITEAHYNIDKSLENIAENRMRQGITNQQYTMTAANNLADLLSDMLNSMQNPSMGSGKGKGKSVSLPDIIQKQKGLGEKMKDGMKKGQKKGKEGKDGTEGQEQMTGEQYQIYQEQQELRKALEELIEKEGKDGKGGGKEGNKAIEKMKELEQQLLDKGFDNKVLERMLQLEHELLKLDDATLKQGKDNKRKSETSTLNYQQRAIKQLQLKKLFFNPNEILNRQPLPLRNNYKKKVQEYFNDKL